MNFKDLIMKWRFRLDHARALFSMFTFAALLAIGYIEYLPFLDRLSVWGVIILTLIIFVVFAIGGYIYDKTFKLWASFSKVNAARNPFTYVPHPKELLVEFPRNYLQIYLLAKNETDPVIKSLVTKFLKTMNVYYSLSPNDPSFQETAQKIRSDMKKLTGLILEKWCLENEDCDDFT